MIAIISDTHDCLPLVDKAIERIGREGVELIVHCGDIVAPFTLEKFEGFNFKFVYGNNDGEIKGLSYKSKFLGLNNPSVYLDFEYLNKRFFVIHNLQDSIVSEVLKTGDYDYILCGHTHVRQDDMVNNTRIINPGALCYRADRASFAFLDVENDNLRFEFI